MKGRLRLAFYAILGAGLLVSCAKNNDNPPVDDTPPQTVQSSMSATINDTEWVATRFSGVNSSGTLQIEGAKSDGSQISLNFPASTKSGSFSAGGMNSYQATYQSGITYSYLTTGTIAITSNANNAVSGTFSGSFKNASNNAITTITKGTFTSSYK